VGDLKLGLFDTAKFASILEAPIRPKKNRTPPIWRLGQGTQGAKGQTSMATMPVARQSRTATLKAIAKRTPEVMVKVTGTNHEGGALQAHLGYLQRKEDAVIENERGVELEASADSMKQVMRRWGVVAAEGEKNRRLREADELEGHERHESETNPSKHDSRKTIAVHIVLSMPAGSDPAKVLDAARGFAQDELENHKYLLVLHTDKEHPHVHVVVNNRGNDGQRLSHKRGDLQRWREVFARELRARGVEANATPRKARGVVKKAEGTVVRQAKTRLAREGRAKVVVERKRPLRVLESSAMEAINLARGVVTHEPTEAELRAKLNRAGLEAGMKDAIRSLEQQGAEGSDVARNIAAFLETMPRPNTAREDLQLFISQNIAAQKVVTQNSTNVKDSLDR
jgi:hypothetical protein